VVSDAAVIAAAYTLLSEVVLYREIPLRELPRIVKESMIPVGAILIILGMGMAITNMLVDQDVPAVIFEAVRQHIENRYVFLVALNLFLLVVGSIMHIYTAIIVIVPLILPVALQYGVNPVHLGVIVLMNLAIGFCTPPVGLDLFVASIRFGVPIQKVCLSVVPFIILLLIALALITYVPGISLFLIK
jgi:tripartite ATP-independent transporter DctM subunit